MLTDADNCYQVSSASQDLEYDQDQERRPGGEHESPRLIPWPAAFARLEGELPEQARILRPRHVTKRVTKTPANARQRLRRHETRSRVPAGQLCCRAALRRLAGKTTAERRFNPAPVRKARTRRSGLSRPMVLTCSSSVAGSLTSSLAALPADRPGPHDDTRDACQ